MTCPRTHRRGSSSHEIFVDSSMYPELRRHSTWPCRTASHLPAEASITVHYYPGAFHPYTARALTTDEGTYSCALRIQPPGIKIPQPVDSAVDKGGLTRQTNSYRGLDMDQILPWIDCQKPSPWDTSGPGSMFDSSPHHPGGVDQ